jgi:hypothetical protein
MTSADERATRKALLQRYRAAQREAAWQRLGIAREQLHDLLEHLDHRLVEPCDETLAMTRRWAEDQGGPWSRFETGLHDAGAVDMGDSRADTAANVDSASHASRRAWASTVRMRPTAAASSGEIG